MEGDGYIIGEPTKPEEKERNRKIGTFLRRALDSGVDVIKYRFPKFNPIEILTIDLPFDMSKDMKVVLDERVKSIMTTQWGVPLPDEKQKNMPEEVWEELRRLVVTGEGMRKVVDPNSIPIFLGGFYEFCLTNAIGYYARVLRTEGKPIYCLKDLSVVRGDEKVLKLAEGVLSGISGLEFICFEDAMELVTSSTSLPTL